MLEPAMRSGIFSRIHLSRGRATSLQNQLVSGIKTLVHEGSLAPGQAVPSSRALASDLGLSRNTVLIALDQLSSEGYLSARPRSGLFINTDLIAGQLPAAERTSIRSRRPATGIAGPIPFHPCQPDVRLFSMTMWNRMRAKGLRAHGPAILHYQSACVLGLPALQQQLAAYLRDSRGVICSPDQIAITSGSQQALYLLAQLLVRECGTIYLEDPGYPGARIAFEAARANLEPLAVDDSGLLVPTQLQQSSAVYTTPSRQFPTGPTLPIARRMALLQAAAASRSWIIEDDYDSEFRYGRAPAPSLHSLDTEGCVIYVGTMSKVLTPALRIGYVVLPSRLVKEFAKLRAIVEDHGPLPDQAALAEFIASGSFYSHIRRCRKEYGARLDAFLSFAREAGLPLRFAHVDGGMNQYGEWDGAPPAATDQAISEALCEAGVNSPPLARYAMRSNRRGLIFGFTAFDSAEIKAGIRRVSAALRRGA